MERGMRIISAVKRVEFVNNKQTTHRLLTEISNRFAVLENLDTKVDVNIAWETIRQIITISA
jgi:hypothetical protein